MFPVLTTTYDGELSLSRAEVLRYMRCREETPPVAALVDEAMAEVRAHVRCRACYSRFPLTVEGDTLHLGFADTQSRSLARHLTGCNEILVFAATVGSDTDRLLTRLAALSPARAVAADAAANTAIEAWCDRLNDGWAAEFAAEGRRLRERFSAGYGDCPLALQIPLIAALDTGRKIGVSLGDNLLMTPTKSVTAIIGICEEDV